MCGGMEENVEITESCAVLGLASLGLLRLRGFVG